MQQSLKRTRVLLAKINKMLDLIEQSDDFSTAERDLVLGYFSDAQRFFKEDVAVYLTANDPEVTLMPTPIEHAEPKPAVEKQPAPPMVEKQDQTVPLIAVVQETMKEAKESLDNWVVRTTETLKTEEADAAQKKAEVSSKNVWGDLLQSAERFLDPKKDKKETPSPEINTKVVFSPVLPETIEEEKPEELPAAIILPPVAAVAAPKKPLVTNFDEEESPSTNLNIDELFVINPSENYGSVKPIKDLWSAFGINERLFNIRELFGKNDTHYNETLDALNALHSFAEAKDYLLQHVIERYEWNTTQRQKKAQGFIRHVWRRFL